MIFKIVDTRYLGSSIEQYREQILDEKIHSVDFPLLARKGIESNYLQSFFCFWVFICETI